MDRRRPASFGDSAGISHRMKIPAYAAMTQLLQGDRRVRESGYRAGYAMAPERPGVRAHRFPEAAKDFAGRSK